MYYFMVSIAVILWADMDVRPSPIETGCFAGEKPTPRGGFLLKEPGVQVGFREANINNMTVRLQADRRGACSGAPLGLGGERVRIRLISNARGVEQPRITYVFKVLLLVS